MIHQEVFGLTFPRYFRVPIHNDLVEIVIKRVKEMLRYPEMIGHIRHSEEIKSEDPHTLTQLASAKHIDETVNYRSVVSLSLPTFILGYPIGRWDDSDL